MAKQKSPKAKKWKMKAESVLQEALPDLATQNKETLRRKLVVLNEEANKRLGEWSRAGKNIREELYVADFNLRLVGHEKGSFTPYKTRRGMTKGDILRDIEKMGGILNLKTSSVKRAREIKKVKEATLMMKLLESGIDYGRKVQQAKHQRRREELGLEVTGETMVPSMEKLGKLMTRLRNSHYIASKAQTGGYSLGSPNVLKNAFQTAFEHPTETVDQLYDRIVKSLKKIEKGTEKRQKQYRDILEEVEDEIF